MRAPIRKTADTSSSATPAKRATADAMRKSGPAFFHFTGWPVNELWSVGQHPGPTEVPRNLYYAATDSADAVNFNPAGTAFLPDDGLYLNFSWQLILKDYKIKYEGQEYGSTKPTPFLPAFYAVYKWKDLAAFAAADHAPKKFAHGPSPQNPMDAR